MSIKQSPSQISLIWCFLPVGLLPNSEKPEIQQMRQPRILLPLRIAPHLGFRAGNAFIPSMQAFLRIFREVGRRFRQLRAICDDFGGVAHLQNEPAPKSSDLQSLETLRSFKKRHQNSPRTFTPFSAAQNVRLALSQNLEDAIRLEKEGGEKPSPFKGGFRPSGTFSTPLWCHCFFLYMTRRLSRPQKFMEAH